MYVTGVLVQIYPWAIEDLLTFTLSKIILMAAYICSSDAERNQEMISLCTYTRCSFPHHRWLVFIAGKRSLTHLLHRFCSQTHLEENYKMNQ